MHLKFLTRLLIAIFFLPIAILVMSFALIKAAGFAYLIFFNWWNGIIYQLPPPLEFSQIIQRDGFSSWMEGCSYKLYRLKPQNITNLRDNGLYYLGNMTWGRDSATNNPYDEWRMTPFHIQGKEINKEAQSLYALRAADGCGANLRNSTEFSDFNVFNSLNSAGNYYSFTQNREGLIIVDTKFGVALVIYFG
jgi:hypothetical protein